MLVVTRKNGEQLIIGENIEVIVLEVRGENVKLGFIAPRDVPIQREEIRQRSPNADHAEHVRT